MVIKYISCFIVLVVLGLQGLPADSLAQVTISSAGVTHMQGGGFAHPEEAQRGDMGEGSAFLMETKAASLAIVRHQETTPKVDCGTGCKDSAALLQSTVEIHGVASALKSTVHYSKQASAGCADKEEDACRSDADCTWTDTWRRGGKGCEKGCKNFGKQFCPDYCFWRLVGDGRNSKCMETIGSMNLGGNEAGASTLGGRLGTKKADVLNRPAYKTSARFDGKTWQACGGEKDCVYTTDASDIKATLGKKSKYTYLAADFAINCALKTDVKILYDVKKSSNFKLKVFYDSKEVEVKWGKQKWGSRKMTVKIDSSDQFPVLRLEISRTDDDEDARFKGIVRLKDVRPSFDQCMETKGHHGQCLAKMISPNGVLRSSHKGQIKCINGDDESESCSEWAGCLSTESKATIVAMASAFDLDVPELPNASQEASGNASIQVLPNASGNDNCKSGGHGECVDPLQIDIEEFDCNCFDAVEGKTEEQINLAMCGSPQVCCTWKVEHCKKPYPKPLSALIQNAMTLRGEDTKVSTHVTNNDGLDGTMTGKCSQ